MSSFPAVRTFYLTEPAALDHSFLISDFQLQVLWTWGFQTLNFSAIALIPKTVIPILLDQFHFHIQI